MNEELFSYNACTGAVCMDHIHIGEEMIPLSQIDKIKVYPDSVHNHYHKIKITHFGNNKLIAAPIQPNTHYS